MTKPQDVAARPLAFDVGMNVGGNLGYYLSKGYRVVAIEANPALVEMVEGKFVENVADGSLIVLNVGVGASDATLPFHINNAQTGLSSFAPPEESGGDWSTIEVPVRPLSALISEYGTPEFLKIDVEGYDAIVLRDLLTNNVSPESIAVEAHGLQSVCALVSMGYSEFQLINAAEVGVSLRDTTIRTVLGDELSYRFDPDSAGPFGDDLTGQWIPAMEMMVQWLGKRVFLGDGWYDLHGRKPEANAVGVGQDARVRDVAQFAAQELLRSSRGKMSRRLSRA